MSIELSDEHYDAMERRIDCPVLWCMGSWLQHGGDGASPETWLHEDEFGIDLGHGAIMARSQEGGGPVMWSFAMDRHSLLTTQEPASVAQMLRLIAQEIDRMER